MAEAALDVGKWVELNRNASIAGAVVAIVVTIVGTAATSTLWQGEPLELTKLGACWLLVGAFAGRIYYNCETPRPVQPPRS